MTWKQPIFKIMKERKYRGRAKRDYRIFIRTPKGVEPRHMVTASNYDDAVKKGESYSLIMGVTFSHAKEL